LAADLDWRWHQAALDCGCMISINPDAHSIRELDHMHRGVEMARKGEAPADRVLNAMSLSELAQYLRQITALNWFFEICLLTVTRKVDWLATV
jgi:histidinol phosphatase-like PHP family hydrolase